MRYANQKQITIKKVPIQKGKPFLMVENEIIFNAAKTLQGNEFKLWCYFAANCDGYEFALSQKAVEEQIGMSKSTYYRAVNALKESGYLYQPNPQVNN